MVILGERRWGCMYTQSTADRISKGNFVQVLVYMCMFFYILC